MQLPALNRRRRVAGGHRFGVALFVSLLLILSAAAPGLAQTDPGSGPPAVDPLQTPQWAVTLQPTALRSQPDDNSEQFTMLRPLSPLQILGYAGDWSYVYNPRSKGTAYVHSDQLGPSDPPSSYIDKDAPPVDQELDRTGQTSDDVSLSYYPTDDPAAAYTDLSAGSSVHVTGSLTGDDGQQWYKTSDGDYVPASAVVFPSAPTAPSPVMAAAPVGGSVAGHWIDVNLNLPARMTAYNGSTAVRSMLTIIGRGPLATPAGRFSVIRRVANETMDSATLGVPRNSPGGYYLKNVLFTQYFLPGGQSIHYNYWSSNWGYPGSHGCLGLSYGDAAFMWDFATIGTPVSIHY